MNTSAGKKLLIVQVAALDYELETGALRFRPIETVFPAVTSTVQASFRTASLPAQHGMIANGLYRRDLRKVMFWEQSAGLVAGPRIWDDCRRRGGRVAVLFWQQSLGEQADLVLSPAPIHKHHGGMIEDCYSRPADLYERLCRAVGRRFKLRHYWGPAASHKAGDWIVEATAAVLKDPDLAPDLCLTYLPTLDYDLQRFGPDSERGIFAALAVEEQIKRLCSAAVGAGYEVLVYGDYGMATTTGPAALPNLALREAGLMNVRAVRGMRYPDLYSSRAFAMVDHEIAHVYVADPADVDEAASTLAALPGVAEVMDRAALACVGLDHPNSGELVLLAENGRWLAYPWWTDRREAPDYARHVDIHNKPGYDPCELFFGWPPMSVSLDTSRIRGTHGRAGPERKVSWAATFSQPREPADLVELAAGVRDWLNEAT